MKRMTDKTRKMIFWIMFEFVMLIFIAAFVIGLVGLIKDITSLIRLSVILMPCGMFVNMVNIFVFKVSDKKSRKSDKEESKK